MCADRVEGLDKGISWIEGFKARPTKVSKHPILPAGSIILHGPLAYATGSHATIIASLDGTESNSIISWILVDSKLVKLTSLRLGTASPIAINYSLGTKPYRINSNYFHTSCFVIAKHHYSDPIAGGIRQHPEKCDRLERQHEYDHCIYCKWHRQCCPGIKHHSCPIRWPTRGESLAKIISHWRTNRPRWRWIWRVTDPKRSPAEYHIKQYPK